jgi:ubiquinone/menaquinone biosynthesis C-methylase UbiE
LGRYGDEVDPDADKKAFNEMKRVLKPHGILIFTTTITRAMPSIAFNAHRIYSHGMIKLLCDGLQPEEEKFYNRKIGGFCSYDQITALPREWDVYCGCWSKLVR